MANSVLAVILGNPAMIDAYKAGIPGNGKPFPDGAKMAIDPLGPDDDGRRPRSADGGGHPGTTSTSW